MRKTGGALPDYLAQDLTVVFVGTSVANRSVSRGHYYAGPGNKFWELLWKAGLTGDELLVPEDDARVLEYGIGLTDVVKKRASSSDSALRASDYDIPGFLEMVSQYEPFAVAFNGKEAARRVARALGRGVHSLGPASWQIGNSRVFVLPSSSGSSADPKHLAPKGSKEEWWRDLGQWLNAALSRH